MLSWHIPWSGQKHCSLTSHVFTFARFRYFWRFLLVTGFAFGCSSARRCFSFFLLSVLPSAFAVSGLWCVTTLPYTGIGSTVSNRKMMAVAVAAVMVTCGIFLPLAVTPCPALKTTVFPFLPTPHRRCVLQDGQEFRIRLLRLVDVRDFNSGHDGATLASSLLREAIASTIARAWCHARSLHGGN